MTSASRTAANAALIGTAIEWYDYFIFGAASALIFNKLFFPNVSALAGTLSSFAVFGVGFLARPLGGVVFGRMGDRVGRKKALIATLLTMGLSTTLIGALPTAATVGVAAPVLLTLLRMLQGVAVGGEWGGAYLVSVEYAPTGQRGRYGAATQMGNGVGVGASTAVFALVSTLPRDELLSWGWRIPFLLSAILVVIGIVLRRALDETPVFRAVQSRDLLSQHPVREALASHKRELLTIAGLKLCESVFGFIVLTFLLSYATQTAGLPQQAILVANTVAAVLSIGVYFVAGILSDRVGRRPVFVFSTVATIVLIFPLCWAIQSGSVVLSCLAVVLGYNIAMAGTYGVEPAYFAELVGPRVRFTVVSVSIQFASIVGGGIAPFIATYLVSRVSGQLWPVGLYVVAAATISLVTALRTPETKGVDLYESLAPRV